MTRWICKECGKHAPCKLNDSCVGSIMQPNTCIYGCMQNPKWKKRKDKDEK